MKNYTTSDLALAAFLKLHGRKLVAASKFPNGRFLFEFDDDGSCASLALNLSMANSAHMMPKFAQSRKPSTDRRKRLVIISPVGLRLFNL